MIAIFAGDSTAEAPPEAGAVAVWPAAPTAKLEKTQAANPSQGFMANNTPFTVLVRFSRSYALQTNLPRKSSKRSAGRSFAVRGRDSARHRSGSPAHRCSLRLRLAGIGPA